MSNPFRFRGQRKDNSEWVVGWLIKLIEDTNEGKINLYGIYNADMDTVHEVHSHTLSISIGKLDSTGTEIFASFPLDGIMTTGGDVVAGISGGAYPVFYNDDNTSFELKLRRIGKEVILGSLDTITLTIIGKGGGNDK